MEIIFPEDNNCDNSVNIARIIQKRKPTLGIADELIPTEITQSVEKLQATKHMFLFARSYLGSRVQIRNGFIELMSFYPSV